MEEQKDSPSDPSQTVSPSISHNPKPISYIKDWIQGFKELSFLTSHWAYFLITCLISSLIFWQSGDIGYVNSLTIVVGSMTQAGLNPVRMSKLNSFQQGFTLFLSVVGNHIVVSMIVIYVRKRAFETRFKKISKDQKNNRNTILTAGVPMKSIPVNLFDHDKSRVLSPMNSTAHDAFDAIIQNYQDFKHHHESLNPDFQSLTDAERVAAQCVEYQAVKFLGYIVLAYYIIWQFFGCVSLGAYIARNSTAIPGINDFQPWWLGTYLGVSAFNNFGGSLLDSNVAPFQKSSYVLISMSILMLAGNTAFPLILRWIIRFTLCITPVKEQYQNRRETLKFILRYPRRVYTNLFPSEQTWCLLASLIFLNGFDWTSFGVLNRHSPHLRALPVKITILDGFFQAISIRSSGFTVLPIESLFVGLQALYVIMMYISAYPITITMRSSNVYEERSLGIYARKMSHSRPLKECDSFNHFPLRRRDRFYFVQEQFRRQLSHDLWFLVIGVVAVVSFESAKFEKNPREFAIFNVIFEIVSAYGCVGLSIGGPESDAAFNGAWHSTSRLILCAVMLRGRHRGLPFDIDKAVELPSEKTITI